MFLSPDPKKTPNAHPDAYFAPEREFRIEHNPSAMLCFGTNRKKSKHRDPRENRERSGKGERK